MSLQDDLKAEAFSLGFLLTGVTTLQPTQHVEDFQRWVQNGLHAGMQYLARPDTVKKRADPSLVFPRGRSIVCLAYPYPQPGIELPPITGKGRLAAYAWGQDYHIIIPPLLEQLALKVASLTGRQIRFRACTDSSPLMERDLAQRAGLGWIGKNTCLIHPRLGSTFFLAELILDLELEPEDAFTADHCGSCQRCIQACPTSCILPDRTIDARRCLSYLTIENKGSFPRELRPALGDWVFGCDVCQQVCPWNQHNRTASPVIPLQDELYPYADLTFDLMLTAEEFTRRFQNSPILRARRAGYLRNIAVVMGNQALPSYVPLLAEIIAHETEPLVRAHAAWALKRIQIPQAARTLDQLRQKEKDAVVLQEMEG